MRQVLQNGVGHSCGYVSLFGKGAFLRSLIAATNASAFPILFAAFHSFVRPRHRHSSFSNRDGKGKYKVSGRMPSFLPSSSFL